MFNLKYENLFNKSILFKWWRVLVIAIFISLLASAIRQFYVQKHNQLGIQQRQQEILDLERKNQELRAKLQDAKTPEFLEREMRKMMGLPEDKDESLETLNLLRSEQESIPKYRQWWNLFVY